MTTLVEEAVERLRDIMERKPSWALKPFVLVPAADLRTLLAALPTDDDVERVARAIYASMDIQDGLDPETADKYARTAIHTLIGRDK